MLPYLDGPMACTPSCDQVKSGRVHPAADLFMHKQAEHCSSTSRQSKAQPPTQA